MKRKKYIKLQLWSKLAWITLSGFMCGLYIRSLHPSSMRKCRHDTTDCTRAEIVHTCTESHSDSLLNQLWRSKVKKWKQLTAWEKFLLHICVGQFTCCAFLRLVKHWQRWCTLHMCVFVPHFRPKVPTRCWAIYFSETAGDQIDDWTQHYAGAVIHHRCRQLWGEPL